MDCIFFLHKYKCLTKNKEGQENDVIPFGLNYFISLKGVNIPANISKAVK